MKIKFAIALVALITLVVGSVLYFSPKPKVVIPGQEVSLGSVIQGSEYHATTTAPNTSQEINLATTTGNVYAFTGGTLGSVIITKAGTASFDIYDVTTTIQGKRAASMTSNTTKLASFPASATVGTYTFDEVFYQGLMIVYSSADIPTTTVTFR